MAKKKAGPVISSGILIIVLIPKIKLEAMNIQNIMTAITLKLFLMVINSAFWLLEMSRPDQNVVINKKTHY